MKKVDVKFIDNGPIRLIVEGDDQVYNDVLFDSEGSPIEIKKNSILCRCGRSKNQPFCDGEHKHTDFDSSNKLKDEIIQRYNGKSINIIFNRSICAGAGTCVRNFPSIYKNDSENWIFPDNASVEEVKESVYACPSGALSFELNSEVENKNYSGSKVTVINKGPLNFLGKITLDGAKWSQNANKTKFSLCRCGESENKPFCDYSHATIKDDSYTF